jgi:phosphatidylglycerol:prolipoprotein diacylglycerol transferase
MLLRCYARITDWIYLTFGQSDALDFRFLPIYSYGFFVAMGFLTAAIYSYREMRRREELGLLPGIEEDITIGEGAKWWDVVLYVFVGFFLLFKIGGIAENAEALRNGTLSFGSFLYAPVPGNVLSRLLHYGNYIAGAIGGILLPAIYYYTTNKNKLATVIREKKMVYTSSKMGDLLIIAAVFGILGANLFDTLENPSEKLSDWQTEGFSAIFSGLSVFGGLICAGIAFAVYAWKRKIHIGHLFDSVAPGFTLANGVGRIGCHVSGDGDWGIVNNNPTPSFIPEWLWKYKYPHNILGESPETIIPGCTEEHCHELAQAVYPTPLYEFTILALACLLLWWLSKKYFTTKPGMVFFIFLICLGVQRFLIEQIRASSERQEFMNLRQAEWISIGMVVAGIVGGIWLWNHYKNKNKAATT